MSKKVILLLVALVGVALAYKVALTE